MTGKLSRCASLEIRISDFGTTYYVFHFTERGNPNMLLCFLIWGIGSWSRGEGSRGSEWWSETVLRSLSVIKTVGNYSALWSFPKWRRFFVNCEQAKCIFLEPTRMPWLTQCGVIGKEKVSVPSSPCAVDKLFWTGVKKIGCKKNCKLYMHCGWAVVSCVIKNL